MRGICRRRRSGSLPGLGSGKTAGHQSIASASSSDGSSVFFGYVPQGRGRTGKTHYAYSSTSWVMERSRVGSSDKQQTPLRSIAASSVSEPTQECHPFSALANRPGRTRCWRKCDGSSNCGITRREPIAPIWGGDDVFFGMPVQRARLSALRM